MSAEPNDIRHELAHRQARWLDFLSRLEVKATEFADAAQTELVRVRRADPDPHKSSHTRLLSAASGQLDGLRDKAQTTWEGQILDFRQQAREVVGAHDPVSRELDEFMGVCRGAHERFEDALLALGRRLRQTAEDDLEMEYQALLASFASSRDQFSCQTCGARLEIERLFFIEVHVACSYCGALHNFKPGAEARRVQSIARDLAVRRCAGALAAHTAEKDEERRLHHETHQLRLSAIGRDERTKAQIEQEIARLEQIRVQAVRDAPLLRTRYLRAVYDQLNLLLPEFRDHHERRFAKEAGSIAEPG
ncbi:MAG: hypothetical protein LBS56_01290 [Propionibacteriaceae bacterium]|jgi:hypothetical protein|nr:hypothetical protein [Propionibacteriaceae bacterium]